ncbi:MAG: signal recognition particle-docking protein FtsY [Tissierellia bacterium]|nr:signal recognition particle-docking protein FtsY [Tissierellia bacterium]
MFNWFKKKNETEIEKIEETENKQDEIEEIVENEYLQDDIIENNEDIVTNKPSFFDKLKNGLSKTRNDMSNKIEEVLNSYKKVDEELFDDLEEVLVMADVGANTTMEIIDRLKVRVKEEKINEPMAVKEVLKNEIKKLMKESVSSNELDIEPLPAVILVVGVNGVGKTTTIGKLSYRFNNEGKKVLIAAGDTFRAAAIEQLEEWANRSNADIISHKEGADPAAVIYDGIQAAKARKTDLLICDTAGRLHNKSNLMNELNKIFRIVDKDYGDATKEVLLVLDATTGQNAINQAKVFKEVVNISGIVLTKLDGTAKGGVIIGLQSELGLPVKLVGVGEGINDLQPFKVDDFVDAIFD